MVGMLAYLKEGLRCVDSFNRAPTGYNSLLLGPPALALERPASASAADEAESWKYIAATMAARVQRLLDKKRVKNQAVTEMTAVYLQTAKSAPRPRPVVQSPTTPAESGDSSGSDSSEISGVSGESRLEGEGVAEAIGVIRSCQDKGESLYTPGVVCRLFGTPELPHKVFPEAAEAMAEQAAGHRNRSYSSSRLYRHSGWSGSGAANSGDRAEIPTQPALSDLQTRAFDRENAEDRGGRRELGACSTGRPSSASATSAAAGSFESGFPEPEPWPDSRGARVCTSEAHACGCKFFRGSIRRLRKRSGDSPSCYRKRQPAALNRCDLKRKKSFGEHVVHVVWHEGFDWHGLGMNVSLICACFGSLGNLEAPQSLQALIVFPSLLCLPSSRVRTPAMFIDVVAATLFAGLIFVWRLLSGIAFWWCSLVLQFFWKWSRRRGLRTKRFRAKCRRKESCFRMKLRNRWVRVGTQRQLVVVRKEKVGCSLLLESMLRKCRLFWHVFWHVWHVWHALACL